MTTIASDEAGTRGLPPFMRVMALRAALAVPLVVLGDFLWRGPTGASLLLLVFALAVAAAAANPWQARGRDFALAGAALLLGALPLVEDADWLPVLFAWAGLGVFALILTGQGTPGVWRKPVDVLLLWLSGPRRLFWDGMVVLEALSTTGWGRSIFQIGWLLGWIVPLGLLAVFLLLFADANPVLLRGLLALDPAAWLPDFEPARIFRWFILLLLVWPFLHVRLMPKAWSKALADLAPPAPATPAKPTVSLSELLFSREAILRSLVLFNLLFALQSGLDALYLWGGVALPEGMTYASYAHRGAYPLIATALLAAAFVLVAMRPKGPAEGSRLLRGLVYLFVAQNVGLVLSSILRLDLYVSVYSLTYWRVAAFIWMGLVAIGLVLIGARIALRRSNGWLVGANLVALTATLYACCFVNFAALIAGFNVEQHLKGTNRNLDLHYLVSLGPDAVPAIDRVLPSVSTDEPMFHDKRYDSATRSWSPASTISRHVWLLKKRSSLATTHAARMGDWRGWTLRAWRLSQDLSAHPEAQDPGPERSAMPPAPPPAAPVEPGLR